MTRPILALLAALLLAGCAEYRLRGIVLAGPAASVRTVDAEDPRLAYIGLPKTLVSVTIDPYAMKPTRLAPVVTDERGQFDVLIPATGAGFLEYELRVHFRRQGYAAFSDLIRLPPAKRRLLITLPEGHPGPAPPRDDLLNETLKLKDQLLEQQ